MKEQSTKFTCRVDLLQQNEELNRVVSFIWFESLTGEEWREIPNTHAMYYVSSLGRVLSIQQNNAKLLKPYYNRTPYLHVGIRFDGEKQKKNVRVHRLVANAFVPNPKGKRIVHHKNGDKTDNRACNLEWVTDTEHAERHRELEKQEKEAKDNEALLSSV